MGVNPRVSLAEFIALRLGNASEPGALLGRMFCLSFGAVSFRDFWRYWNPVYGYVLNYYCYKPLQRLLPRPVCVVATFAASGFILHDLPFGWWIRALRTNSLPLPFVALWFSLMGLLVLLTDSFNLSWGSRSALARAALNGACIVLPFFIALLIQGIA